MNKWMASALVFVFSLVGASAHAGYGFDGKFETEHSTSIELMKSNGNPVALSPGGASISISTGLMRSWRDVTLTTSSGSLWIRVPKASFGKDTPDFEFASDSGTILKARTNLQVINKRTVVREATCSYSGYCRTCSMDTKGNWSCSNGYSSSCTGSIDSLYEIVEGESQFIVDVLNKTANVAGRFASEPKVEKIERHLGYSGSCR